MAKMEPEVKMANRAAMARLFQLLDRDRNHVSFVHLGPLGSQVKWVQGDPLVLVGLLEPLVSPGKGENVVSSATKVCKAALAESDPKDQKERMEKSSLWKDLLVPLASQDPKVRKGHVEPLGAMENLVFKALKVMQETLVTMGHRVNPDSLDHRARKVSLDSRAPANTVLLHVLHLVIRLKL